MPVSSEDTFVSDLMQVLGLPKGVTAFSLHAAVRKLLIVECTYLPNPKDHKTVLTERFTLERMAKQEPKA